MTSAIQRHDNLLRKVHLSERKESRTVPRRALLAGASAAGALGAIPPLLIAPASGADQGTEPLSPAPLVPAENDARRFDRMSQDMSEFLDTYLNGRFRVVIEPSQCARSSVWLESMDRNDGELSKLIREHRRVSRAFSDACDAADEMSPRYAGAEGKALYARLDLEEQRAFKAVVRYLPTTLAEVRVQARYALRQWTSEGIAPDGEVVRTLMRSLVRAGAM